MQKVLIVFGTRPEAIKMVPLVKELYTHDDIFEIKVCVTAQHREMLDQVLDFFDIDVDYDLNIMNAGQDLYDITTKILLGMKKVLHTYKPDIVFVHGDTSTTFAAALASFYQQIKVAHIEAGLRTGNIYAPWPEEANRTLTTHLTTYHFAPTLTARDNLLKENVKNHDIEVVGNTVIDALFLALEKIRFSKQFEINILKILTRYNYKFQEDRNMILVTGHRRENHGQGLIDICCALKEIALNNPDVDIVYPVHLNPNVQEQVKTLLSNISNIYLIKPLRYEYFVYMMDKSYFIITDSGGIQEEAPALGKPVLVMRETTERPEALLSGTVKLVGTDKNKIVNETQKLLENKAYYLEMSKAHNPYGNGDACKKIVNFMYKKLKS